MLPKASSTVSVTLNFWPLVTLDGAPRTNFVAAAGWTTMPDSLPIRVPVADLDEASIVADEAAVAAEDLSVFLLGVPPERRQPYRDRLVRARDLLAELLAELRRPEEPQVEGPPPVRRKARAWDTLPQGGAGRGRRL